MEQTRQENSMRDIGVLLMVIVVAGPLIGVAAASLSLLLEMTQHVMLGGVESVAHPEGVSLPIRRVVSILVASFVAAVIWWLIRRRHTIPSVGQAVHGKSMPVLASLVHIVLQIFIVGSGLSIGRETAPRELGALIGQKLSGWLRVSTKDMALITACCAGAGFAGVYDAPLAGMFFAVEMLLVDASIRTVGVALGTSVVAAFSASLIKGNAAFYHIDPIVATPHLMIVCVIVGPVMGVLGYLFRQGTSWASTHQTRSIHILWQLPLVGLLTGGIAYYLPQIMGNGRGLAQTAYNAHTQSAVLILLALAAIKTVATIATVRSGASGGVLTPAIAAGGALGAVIAICAAPILPGVSISVVALIASAAFLATSQKAPLMASCLMIELSHSSVHSLVAVGTAVALSVLVSHTLSVLFSQRNLR
ncbi:chemotaxis protein CheV [Alloscardovia omnicolens]|uniref:chloride channel protein n=1 Tax=Alloscardovia omnicolens TaxID=419015 RepID=UPI000C773D92|nr:chloride channel protein [Alloscardovia omnicolens]PKY79442.1 chemotaxis protein CheV [Alloscardovia omnicolens]